MAHLKSEVLKKILTMFTLGTLLKETKREKRSLKKNNGINKSSTHHKTDKTHHVIAPSVLFNADIALRTLRTIRTAKNVWLVLVKLSVNA